MKAKTKDKMELKMQIACKWKIAIVGICSIENRGPFAYLHDLHGFLESRKTVFFSVFTDTTTE